MAPKSDYPPLEDLIDLFPSELKERQERQRLRKLARQLDELTALDEAGQLIADREVFRRCVRDKDVFPEDLQDRVSRPLESQLGTKLKSRGNGRRLRWRDLAERQDSLEPVPTAELRQLGIDPSASIADVRAVIEKHYPDIPKVLLGADGVQLGEIAQKALHHNRTVWDCVVAKLGFWAALWVFAVAGAFLIVGTATGPWGVPLAVWLIGVLGGGTAVLVMNCVLNPNL